MTFKVLLVEDNPTYAAILKKRLADSKNPFFEVVHFECLEPALKFLNEGKEVDIILLDLFLPDSKGMDTFKQIRSHAPGTAIVVLTMLDDEAAGLEAVKSGAQDYLIKGKFGTQLIARILWYAVERHRLQSELVNLSLNDDLTGLYNRRGFFALAEHEVKLNARTKDNLTFIFVDVDGLKKINDAYGHKEGDWVLTQTAEILKTTFRKSDIIARISGDEFVVLAVDSRNGGPNLFLKRLDQNVKAFNTLPTLRFQLSLSAGARRYDPAEGLSLDALIAEADRIMYESKLQKRESQKKILIIEDDYAIQKFLSARLRKLGYQVNTAGDGEQGLEEARHGHPDLIILDLMLPKFCGEEVCKAIREDRNKLFSRVPIIMLTAKGSDVDHVIGKVIGANEYVTKPFSAEDLVEKIARLVQ
ncbi:MAG: response regulator [Candidatus Omnitrophica bacterium]|nr:response regulator [Candidatus Omnitrophota bacterium]